MTKPLLCLCLMERTLEEDVALARRYDKYIDMVELRADRLCESEWINIRNFPSMCNKDAILTIRRECDGGSFSGGEGERTTIFARAMAFCDEEGQKKFSYVDFEEDYHISGLEDAVLAFGLKIIRSFHNMNGNCANIKDKLEALRKSSYEIPKIAFMPQRLSDVTALFRASKGLGDTKQIFCAMGSYGVPARVLSGRLNSYICYSTPAESQEGLGFLGHIDPVQMQELYGFRNISAETKIFGITGFPLNSTGSPKIHNKGYKDNKVNAVYIPVKSDTIEEALDFAKEVGMKGLSVTVPHKEKLLDYLTYTSPQVKEIGACNTVVFSDEGLRGYNTDSDGFQRALIQFCEGASNIRHKKVALIGSGGAARAVSWVLHELEARVCVFNRTISRAKSIAEQYGFKYASLGPESVKMVEEYSPIIVQTTTVGSGRSDASCPENDPLWFYGFSGTERVMDIVYTPEVTPLMARAKASGCKVANGLLMLINQAHEQFRLFTGIQSPLGL